MKRLKNIALFLLCNGFIFLNTTMNAQQQNVPLNKGFSYSIEKEIIQSDSIQHFGFLPLLQSRVKVDNVEQLVPSLALKRYSNRSFTARKLFHEHVIQYDSGEVQFTIDPLVNFEFGKEDSEAARDQQLYKNMRGFVLRVNLGSKVSVESSFRENQVELPTYLNDKIKFSEVAYGQGRVKKFNDTGYDFAMASSTISYSPSDKVNIQVGHGKHFVGYGHRSLLLSDLAFNYPYLKLNTLWFKGKLQYQNLYASFQDLIRLDSDFEGEGLFQRKQGAFHYLDYAVNSKLNIGLFEGIMMQSIDTSGNVSVPANFWVPVIFLNTLLEDDSDKGNTLIGLNTNYKLSSNWQVYGQFAGYGLKDMEASYQLGSKYYFESIPVRLQVELNSKAKNLRSNMFDHYNESLADPLGSEMTEVYTSLLFKKNRYLTQLGGSYRESRSSETRILDVRQSYIVNPAYNLTLSVGALIRDSNNETEPENYFYVGLSTNLQNLYFDY